MSEARLKFGAVLRAEREKKKKSMGELARFLEVSVVFVSDVERGNRAPFTRERILATAAWLGIDPQVLFVAAADSRGFFQLDATNGSDKKRELGASLMRGWENLSDDDVEQLAQILRKAKGE
jgi:transcriptional regulator with XRE-family HTH domain